MSLEDGHGGTHLISFGLFYSIFFFIYVRFSITQFSPIPGNERLIFAPCCPRSSWSVWFGRHSRDFFIIKDMYVYFFKLKQIGNQFKFMVSGDEKFYIKINLKQNSSGPRRDDYKVVVSNRFTRITTVRYLRAVTSGHLWSSLVVIIIITVLRIYTRTTGVHDDSRSRLLITRHSAVTEHNKRQITYRRVIKYYD